MKRKVLIVFAALISMAWSVHATTNSYKADSGTDVLGGTYRPSACWQDSDGGKLQLAGWPFGLWMELKQPIHICCEKEWLCR